MQLFIVTVEDNEDGTFFEDPQAFDTEREAIEYATKQPAPKDHVVAVYGCDLITTFDPNIL